MAVPMAASSLVALAVSVVACTTDLRNRRIPNVLTLGSALAALVYSAATGGPHAVLAACEGWAVGVACFAVPFVLGGMGAGDVKLLGALGAWLGPMAAIWLALYAGVAGGVLALVVSFAHGYMRTALRNVRLLLTHWRVNGFGPVDNLTLASATGPRLAYAVPIFVGTMVTIWLHS
jgi:prepilin peptidase CpaA